MINAKDSYNTFYSLNQKSGIPLVFIHGVGLNNTIWEPQVNAFENSVLTYDILGHGKTPFSKDEISFDIFSDQLLNLKFLFSTIKLFFLKFILLNTGLFPSG